MRVLGNILFVTFLVILQMGSAMQNSILSVCGCREERTSSPLLYIFKMIFIKNFFIIFLNVFKNNKKISLFFK